MRDTRQRRALPEACPEATKGTLKITTRYSIQPIDIKLLNVLHMDLHLALHTETDISTMMDIDLDLTRTDPYGDPDSKREQGQ